jgi:hypothetical protein
MKKFTDVLEEYLYERDRQNSNYYDNRYIGERTQGRYHMEDLAKELNKMIHGVEYYDYK